MNNNQKITVPEIRWPDFIPPPEREGMRFTNRVEIRSCKAGDISFFDGDWFIYPEDRESTPNPVAIYEPAPILCPECGAEMKLRDSKEWMGTEREYYFVECSGDNYHWRGPYFTSKEESLSSAECLRGLWEKK